MKNERISNKVEEVNKLNFSEYPTNIQKEEIAFLHFPKEEILTSKFEMEKRIVDAYRGMLLGNIYKNKVKIIFEDFEGVKLVETTIWGLTERWILLKKGLVIPLHRIHKIIS